MFLKQITLQGFKSFASKTTINFDSDYTGIVGPNGCGKSNIIDAIRWVLGEQSAKNMRGFQMSDVIFAGSENKRGVNIAEVTLLFDNSKHLLNSDFQELEITRRLYKNTNESEYLINNSICRLKDVVDLTLDTGLGKDSLSIISQGTIQAFSEAKPIERRALFEEAAGVAKYKKRKIESLSKLERTQDNIDRLNDIIQELEKQVSPLKRQAKKAEQYLVKKQRLTEIEVAVIVNDINNLTNDLKTIEQQLFDVEYKETTTKASIQILDSSANELKEEITHLDSEVQKLQDRLFEVINDIQSFEKRKVEIEEKRRYIKETGTSQDKIIETKNLLDTAYNEYIDRKSRQNKLIADIDLADKSIEQLKIEIGKLQGQINESNNKLNHLNSRKSVLDNLVQSPFENQNGVRTIVKNKAILTGICDPVSNLITADDGYQQMASIALANGLYHIVTEDVKSAKKAISFLKSNKAGNATFLPLSVMKPRYVNKEQLFICENTEGFLGIASDFVGCDEKYDVIVLALLGNVIVCDTLDHASDLASRLNYQYKIITVDGDVIYKGGSLSGGYNKQTDSPLTYQNQLTDVKDKISECKQKINDLTLDYTKLVRKKDEQEQARITNKVSLASLNELVDIKKDKYEKLKEEYNRLSPTDENGNNEDYSDELIKSLNAAYAEKDSITSLISQKRERRVGANNEYQRKYVQLRQVRDELNTIVSNSNGLLVDKAKIIANRDNALARLARDYSLTYENASSYQYDVDLESASQEVVALRQEITDLGNINLDAPQSYQEVNERYEFMDKQLKDLNEAKDKLLSVINEMDEIMSQQFDEMFNKINDALPEVFNVLFGGGKAKLVLEDPQDILNTGIDIDVQPPGKNIQNIRLFSGGEKSLIAICVLFAILKVRSVPLCIFDEVEASLDQGNVERFAKYIHQFASDSQFIVITHRPGTMSECDILYGVTMQQKGVSNIIKVKLKEAMDYIEKEQSNGTVQ